MPKKNMKFKRYEGGGEIMGETDPKEAADKEAGLRASKGEDVGFLQRLRMGNIDDPSSEAYKRFGAGRGRATSAPPAEEEAPKPQVVARPPAKPNPIFAAGLEQGKRQPSGDASVAEDYSGPRTKPIVTSAEKPAASKPTAPKPTASKPTESKTKETDKPSKYPGALRGMRSDAGTSPPVATHGGPRDEEKSAASKIPGQSAKAPQGEKIDSSETERNVNAALTATGLGGAAAGAYKLKKMYDASKAAKQALSNTKRLERPGTVAGKDFLMRDYEGAAKTASKGVPKKQLGFKKDSDVSDVVPKKTSYRSETNPTKREDARANEARDSLKNFLNRDLDRDMKKGGSVKKYSSGGMTSSASRRADGIATKGKTRGKMC